MVILLSHLAKKLSRGPARKIDQLRRPLEDLLKRGFDGGTLIIDHPKTGTFIQFKKYILEKDNYGIELFYPEVEWSKGFISEFKKWSRSNDLEVVEVYPGVDSPLHFYKIDFSKNTDSAFECVKGLFDVFGVPNASDFYILLENADPRDVLITNK